MKTRTLIKIIASTIAAISTSASFAQWTQTGSILYPNNASWSVGIGNSSPSFKLDVTGDINFTSTNGLYIGGYLTLWTNNNINNVYLGRGSGSTLGDKNTFLGSACGSGNSGDRNVFCGFAAGYENQKGKQNVFIGGNAGEENNDGDYNVMIGDSAGFGTSHGSNNTICGTGCGLGVDPNGDYSNNSFFGFQAGYNTTTGGNNCFFGHKAGYSNTTGTPNICLGESSGYYNQTGNYNTITGNQAGYGVSTFSYNYSSFYGYQAGYGNKGDYNTFYGYKSGVTNTTGFDNVFAGANSGYNNTTGSYNVMLGYNSGASNTTGAVNVFIGYQAGYLNVSGQSCTYVGKHAGYNSTGGNNTFFGYHAGYTNTTGSTVTCVGYTADVSSTGYTNATALGNGATVNASNKIRVGNASVTVIEGQVAFTTSDSRFKFNVKEDVKGLEFIKKLRPVSYQFDTKKFDNFLIKNMPDSIKALHANGSDYTSSTNIIRTGFLAQEVEQAAKDCGFVTDIVHAPADSSDNYSLQYGVIVVPLVKAVQELSKQLDSLKAATTQTKSHSNYNPNQNNPMDTVSMKLTLPDAPTIGEPQPNPNNGSTQIPFYLPDNVSGAKVQFVDMLGRTMQEKILQPGYGLIKIDTQDLPQGTYVYSLIINGKVIDTKKMMRGK